MMEFRGENGLRCGYGTWVTLSVTWIKLHPQSFIPDISKITITTAAKGSTANCTWRFRTQRVSLQSHTSQSSYGPWQQCPRAAVRHLWARESQLKRIRAKLPTTITANTVLLTHYGSSCLMFVLSLLEATAVGQMQRISSIIWGGRITDHLLASLFFWKVSVPLQGHNISREFDCHFSMSFWLCWSRVFPLKLFGCIHGRFQPHSVLGEQPERQSFDSVLFFEITLWSEPLIQTTQIDWC